MLVRKSAEAIVGAGMNRRVEHGKTRVGGQLSMKPAKAEAHCEGGAQAEVSGRNPERAAVSAEPKCDPLIQERWSLAKSLLLSFPLPLFIGLFAPSLIRPFIYLFCAAALFLPGVILAGVIYDWLGNSQPIVRAFFKRIHPLPPGTVSGTDLKVGSLPRGTLALVAANTLLFFALPIDTVKRGVFFPFGQLTILHLSVSFFSSAFLHADIFHLLAPSAGSGKEEFPRGFKSF